MRLFLRPTIPRVCATAVCPGVRSSQNAPSLDPLSYPSDHYLRLRSIRRAVPFSVTLRLHCIFRRLPCACAYAPAWSPEARAGRTRAGTVQLARTRAASIPRTVRRCGTLLVCSPNQICFTRILLLVRPAALYAKRSPRVSAKCCSDVPCIQEGAKTMRFLFSNKNSSQRGSPQLTAFFVPLFLFFLFCND